MLRWNLDMFSAGNRIYMTRSTRIRKNSEKHKKNTEKCRLWCQWCPTGCQMASKRRLLEVIWMTFWIRAGKVKKCVWITPACVDCMWALPGKVPDRPKNRAKKRVCKKTLPKRSFGAHFSQKWRKRSQTASQTDPNGINLRR